MTEIYLMRHGQTLFNQLQLNQGQCDAPLTEYGIQQAKAAGAWFQNHGVHFDDVYTSNLTRACDTAELITSKPYHRLRALREISLGTWEASPVYLNPSYPYGDFFVKYGGESLDQVKKRFYDAMKEIGDENAGKTVLVVAHGMATMQFFEAISFSYESASEFSVLKNGGFAILDYDGKAFHVKQIVNPLEEKQ